PYCANSKAWMNSSLFDEVLKYMNNEFRVKNKKVLLLVDNALLYFDPNNCLQDIKIEQNNNIDVIDTNIIKVVVKINKDNEYKYNSYGEESSISARSCGNFCQNRAKMLKLAHANMIHNQEDILINEQDNANQMVKEIPTEDVLNENDIIYLIQEEVCIKSNNLNHLDDSEEKPVLVSL
ncbi:11621_t:CDS:2, partial [Dentiscutata heterogama]